MLNKKFEMRQLCSIHCTISMQESELKSNLVCLFFSEGCGRRGDQDLNECTTCDDSGEFPLALQDDRVDGENSVDKEVVVAGLHHQDPSPLEPQEQTYEDERPYGINHKSNSASAFDSVPADYHLADDYNFYIQPQSDSTDVPDINDADIVDGDKSMTSLVADGEPLSSDSASVVFNVNVESLSGTSDDGEQDEAPVSELLAEDIARNTATSDNESVQVQSGTSHHVHGQQLQQHVQQPDEHHHHQQQQQQQMQQHHDGDRQHPHQHLLQQQHHVEYQQERPPTTDHHQSQQQQQPPQQQHQHHHRMPCWEYESHERQCLNEGRCFAIELHSGLRRTGCR